MKASTHKVGKPYDRRLHVDGKEWSWRISKSRVWIRSPNGKMTINADIWEVTGYSEEEYSANILDGRWDQPSIDVSPYPPITPSDIVNTIRRYIGPKKDEPARIL